jgi:hypothetical protein
MWQRKKPEEGLLDIRLYALPGQTKLAETKLRKAITSGDFLAIKFKRLPRQFFLARSTIFDRWPLCGCVSFPSPLLLNRGVPFVLLTAFLV